MRVRWPGDCAKNSKLKNVGFSLSPHFRIFYILTPDPPRWRPDMLSILGYFPLRTLCWQMAGIAGNPISPIGSARPHMLGTTTTNIIGRDAVYREYKYTVKYGILIKVAPNIYIYIYI